MQQLRLRAGRAPAWRNGGDPRLEGHRQGRSLLRQHGVVGVRGGRQGRRVRPAGGVTPGGGRGGGGAPPGGGTTRGGGRDVGPPASPKGRRGGRQISVLLQVWASRFS